MDNTPGPHRTCTLNKALLPLNASLYSHVASKAYTPSVIKQSDLKCFREAPVVSFHLTRYSFIMTDLVYLECMASSLGNSTLYTINTLHLATWHGLYKSLDQHEGERRGKLKSLLLFCNTLHFWCDVL